MDFLRGLTTNRKGNDYLFMVVDRFNKMCIIMHYKKTISGVRSNKIVLWIGLVHFGIPRSIVSNRDTMFVGELWSTIVHTSKTHVSHIWQEIKRTFQHVCNHIDSRFRINILPRLATIIYASLKLTHTHITIKLSKYIFSIKAHLILVLNLGSDTNL